MYMSDFLISIKFFPVGVGIWNFLLAFSFDRVSVTFTSERV